MKKIYLDYNATTPVAKEVAEEMMPYLLDYFGNPSSIHEFGLITKKSVEKARQQIADLLNCKPSEIIFTSGGTESNNYALKGSAFYLKEKGNHIITSTLEHPAVFEVCSYLEKNGFEISYIKADEYGTIDIFELEKAIKPSTILITVMHANNEIGTIQPISEINEIAKKHNIRFHTDAAQSVGKIKIDVDEMGIDLLSVAGHKLYAPKGIGALFIKEGTKLEKFMHGANHERNLRAGTENVLEIVGLGKACEIAKNQFHSNYSHLLKMRNLLFDNLKKELTNIKLNGHPENRLPNTLSISFPNIEANTLLKKMENIAASAGAACHSEGVDLSTVLKAIKVPVNIAMGTIRFSVGKYTTENEINEASKIIIENVNNLNKKSMIETIKLTSFSSGLGCASKMSASYLQEVLAGLPISINPNVLVGNSTSDDAAVYKLSEDIAIVQTVDFFAPIVNDPYDFGQIAAANAISDIYAMGATPLFALNVVGFPDASLPQSTLKQILKGASDKAAEAGIEILGGHTVKDDEPKFGMTVTGSINPKKIMNNASAKPGDAIILTKPLGSGIITTGIKAGIVEKDLEKRAIKVMSLLNKSAAETVSKFPVNSCTDVTGFGLIGHLSEMTYGSKVNCKIYFKNLPFIEGLFDLPIADLISGGTKSNTEFVENKVVYENTFSELDKLIINDAQTSGGLLVSIPMQFKDEFISECKKQGLNQTSFIGEMTIKGEGKIEIVK
ncbi:MAG: selenide, water dikinase SelD [Bacteroidales bacterium]|nr:selenide, water dikinase SelD [Bacteroidales bacterium]MBN2757723.1 selenide, water dikinase SelD [Bacteroidales bacterium]